MNGFSLSGFHFRVFYDFHFERNITFYRHFTFGLRAIFILCISWFDSFNLGFSFTCFFIESGCNNNFTRSTVFYLLNFSGLQFRIVFEISILRNFFFLNNRLDADFNNSLHRIFCFFLGYEFVLIFIIRSCNRNFTFFAGSYFLFLAYFNIFIIDVFSFKGFFNFFYNGLDADLDDLIDRFFSGFEFAFFGFLNFAVFDYESVRSFLLARCASGFFPLAGFKIFIVFNSGFERQFFLFSYFMSTVVGAFAD